ncbi:MAG: phage shock protein A [Candidatus Azotimanducaceae bacterium]|jgi:phage shock protein A
MSILKKIMTAVRGGAREVGELIVDANGTRIFEQEIRDAQTHLHKARQDLTDLMARQMQASREVVTLQRGIKEHESHARQALDTHHDDLALQVANKIALMEGELAEQQEAHATFGQHVEQMRQLVQKTQRQVKDYERQLSMLRTTESVQKASAAIADNFATSQSRILSAKDSLVRIRQRQQRQFDRMAAADTLQAQASDLTLGEELQAAGIGEQPLDGSTVLARLKASRA